MLRWRRRSGERVVWSDNAAYNLGASAQPYWGEVARAEPSLGRRATLSGDAENSRRCLAVLRLQRVLNSHTRTLRDARVRTSACQYRILERWEGMSIAPTSWATVLVIYCSLQILPLTYNIRLHRVQKKGAIIFSP